MDFEYLQFYEINEQFFKDVVFAVWNTYDGANNFEFLGADGNAYRCGHPKKLDKAFPVVKNLDWSKRGWENWTWYYMGMGGGVVFVRNDILERYKVHAGIDDDCIEYGPDWNAAKTALAEMVEQGLITVPEKMIDEQKRLFYKRRAERFTWGAGDLVFYKNQEEMIESAKKEGRTVRLYGQNGAPDTIISPD